MPGVIQCKLKNDVSTSNHFHEVHKCVTHTDKHTDTYTHIQIHRHIYTQTDKYTHTHTHMTIAYDEMQAFHFA